MSWLARSIANSLRLEEDEDEAAEKPDDVLPRPTGNQSASVECRRLDSALFASRDLRLLDSESDASDNRGGGEDPGGDYNQGRGVKEDLSEFRDSLTRHLWGVASLIAPPPALSPPSPPPPLGQNSDSLRLESESESDRSASDVEGEENEELEYNARLPGQFAEQGDLSQLEDYYANMVEEAVGISDEVLAFARNIAHHPETWLDFPLSEEEDFDDLDISDAQYKHAIAVEHLAPRLAALRIEFCPVHMSVGYFWMVYFVLLNSRLNKRDADLLSSPQLVKARAMWMQALQKQTKEEYGFGASSFHLKESPNSPRENFMMHSYKDAHFGNPSDQIEISMQKPTAEHEIEKHPVNEIEFVDKSVIREDPAPKLQDKEMITGSSSEIPVEEANGDDYDDWLKEDSDLIGYSSHSILVNEDDISFSDLEDDCTMPIKYNKIPSAEENKSAKT